MTEEDRHVCELFLFDFELNGIHLEEKKRQYVVDLNNFILISGQRFMIAAEKPRIVDRTGLPDVLLKEYKKQDVIIYLYTLFLFSFCLLGTAL